MPNSIAKNNVDLMLARAIWASFADWRARLDSTSVGPDQRKPNGKVKRGRANWQSRWLSIMVAVHTQPLY